MSNADLKALEALYSKLMKLYTEGDERLGWVIMNLSGAIVAAKLWRKDLNTGSGT